VLVGVCHSWSFRTCSQSGAAQYLATETVTLEDEVMDYLRNEKLSAFCLVTICSLVALLQTEFSLLSDDANKGKNFQHIFEKRVYSISTLQ